MKHLSPILTIVLIILLFSNCSHYRIQGNWYQEYITGDEDYLKIPNGDSIFTTLKNDTLFYNWKESIHVENNQVKITDWLKNQSSELELVEIKTYERYIENDTIFQIGEGDFPNNGIIVKTAFYSLNKTDTIRYLNSRPLTPSTLTNSEHYFPLHYADLIYQGESKIEIDNKKIKCFQFKLIEKIKKYHLFYSRETIYVDKKHLVPVMHIDSIFNNTTHKHVATRIKKLGF